MAPASASSTFTPLILDRLVGDGHDADTWSYLVLAACEGPAQLAAVLDGGKTPAPRALTPSKLEAATEPPGAYLSAIIVEGFRGIATRATLNLPPGPGLTLVVGRNGSGKSSFAEALELLLTGGNRRWDGRSSVWKDGWRCLHHPHPCAIQAEFHVEGRGPVTVARQWAEDAALEDSEAWFQEKSKARRPYAELGWQAVSEIHRPLLPYSELGTVFDNPSDIHDALAQVLGLGELDDILKVLQNEKKARQSRVDSATSRLDSLLPRLQAIVTATGDARAERCVAALKGKKKTLDAVAEVLDNDSETPADPSVALLRRVHIQAPAREQVEEAARGLVEAVTAVEQSASTDAGRARSLAKLLEQALQFHASHGEAECPVCHAPGRLGPAWRDETTAELTRLRTEANAAEQGGAWHERAEFDAVSATGEGVDGGAGGGTR